MANRREILQIGIAATAWPLASPAVRAAGIAAAAPVPLYALVVDRRFEESVAFGRRAAALGLATREIDGDMTRLWYDDLYHAWRRGPIAVGGLTANGPMFCFDQLGRDQGMRLVFRAEHRRGHDRVDHDLLGPLGMLGDSAVAADAGPRWPACMADVVARCPSGRAEISTARVTTAAAGRAAGAEPLYTWVLAPARHA